MAKLGSGPLKTGEVAATLGVEAQAVATVRQHLINKGMVWSQRHGETAFTVPLFKRFHETANANACCRAAVEARIFSRTVTYCS